MIIAQIPRNAKVKANIEIIILKAFERAFKADLIVFVIIACNPHNQLYRFF